MTQLLHKRLIKSHYIRVLQK